MLNDRLSRPHISAILAMSADGKITDVRGSAARFPSTLDKAHLEAQVAEADATLFGAGTLRAYQTTLPVSNPCLIAARKQRHQPEQPVQIVCSASGQLDPSWRFFQQPVPRWLLTSPMGLQQWRSRVSRTRTELASSLADSLTGSVGFEKEIAVDFPFCWTTILSQLRVDDRQGRPIPLKRLLVMGGGKLMAALLAEGLINDLYLTICPVLIGGKTAPTPVDGEGFTLPDVPHLKLQQARTEGDELFLHYSVQA